MARQTKVNKQSNKPKTNRGEDNPWGVTLENAFYAAITLRATSHFHFSEQDGVV